MSSRFPMWYPDGTHHAPAFPSGWDAANLGGIVLNAKAAVTGLALSTKIDPRKKKGANASHPTSHGLDVSEGALRLCVWTRRQMDDVDDAAPLLCPPTNLLPVPLDHPQLRTIIRLLGGQFNVIVKGISPWVPSSVVAHGWECSLPVMYWPQAQRTKGESKTPAKPATYDDVNNRAAADRGAHANPLPTASPSYAAPSSAR